MDILHSSFTSSTYLNLSVILIDPDPLVLTMISHSYINLALNSLMDEPRAHIVLKHPTEDEVVSLETEAVRRSGREFFKNCVIPNKKVDCNKVKEGRYVKWRDVDVDANWIYGLLSQELLFTLLNYGQINGGYIPRWTQMRGSCLFHSICKSIKCPGEFSNTHLRWMVVLFMVENFDMLWPLLHICVLNMMWKVRISVLHSGTLVAIKFRHLNISMKADIILVHCSGSHYIPLGRCLFISFPFLPFIL